MIDVGGLKDKLEACDVVLERSSLRQFSADMSLANPVSPGCIIKPSPSLMFGPHTSNYHIWLRRIKKALDPNAAAVSSYYVTA